jgi:hypothetical protein
MTEKTPRKGMQPQLLGLFAFIVAMVFLPTTIFLVIAMLPTFVAVIADRTRRKYKAITVGAMNVAGCTPFLISLWTKGHSIAVAVGLATNPQTIVVVWLAAAVGYLIDWSMSGIVATVMVQRSAGRLREIQKRQAELVERWGDEVTGDIPLDRYGFRIEGEKQEAAARARKDKPAPARKGH